MTDDGISIQPLTDYDDLLACETIQRLAWKMTEDRDIVPAHMLKPVAEHGGVVLGAFNRTRELVGFVFGFIGKADDERAHLMGTPYLFCSEMMGILPEYRSQSVGYRLKLAQRDFALAEGYRLMIWTYDPLLSLNANLNITKLGCIARHYVEDAYGQMGGIYAGLNTDRFSVEWWIGSQHVAATLSGANSSGATWLSQDIQPANTVVLGQSGLPGPGNVQLSSGEPRCRVEIPSDIQAIKQADMGLAIAWRAHTRQLFEEAFSRGYAVQAFGRGSGEQAHSSFYLLSNQLDIPSMARGEA